MTRQTLLGVFFLLMGAVVVGASLVAKPIEVMILLIGGGFAVFGAFLLPSSGAAPAFTQFVVTIAPFIPRIGGSRAGDPPA